MRTKNNKTITYILLGILFLLIGAIMFYKQPMVTQPTFTPIMEA